VSSTVLKTLQQCEDLAHGLAFLGTGGGGGSQELAVDLLSRALGAALQIRLVDAGELVDTNWTVTVSGGGSVGGVGGQGPSDEELASLGLAEEKYPGFGHLTGSSLDLLVDCVHEMEEYARVKIDAIVPGELGCFNGVVPIVVASLLGLPVVDADYCGRALPYGRQCIPAVSGLSMLPRVIIDRWGDTIVIAKAASAAMAERIAKQYYPIVFGSTGSAWLLMQPATARDVMARNSLTKALRIGEARRQALEKGENPVDAIVDVTDGWLLFKGEVTEEALEDRGEAFIFGYGTHRLIGVDEYAGQTFDVWYQNENHIAWKNGEPLVTSPDLICLVDLDTGAARPNDLVEAGWRAAVVGVRGHPAHRTEKGLEVLGPRFFGYDFDYVPIEERMQGV
jgi:DUF917 family protein